ncbi:MAG: mechanosensitive ion channel [Aggregatilineales bacterium]
MDFESAFWQYLVPIGAYFFFAWIVHMVAKRVTPHFVGLSGYAPENLRPREERQLTLNELLSSAISFLAFLIAFILTLGLFIDTTTLVWMIGLFSAAFGLGARPLISDYLTGATFIFDDQFDIGEKVEILGVEGVIEKISLRTVTLRSPTGELYTIPNGEVRVVRNFSRGRFSPADITIKLETVDLNRAIPLLEALGVEAVELLPNLLEPWHVINTSGAMGQHAEITLLTKARFGKAAEMRPRLLALIQERLIQQEISIGD